MTEYAIYGIGTTGDKQIVAHIKVGKRDRLESVALDRAKAWQLVTQLTSALRQTETP